MSMLDDAAVFATIVTEGGFSRAATKLGLSNGMVSRRLAKLETELGVTLLKRTTRQIQLTPEGEVFWQHAKRIQQELDAALSVIHTLADKPKGNLRISAPPYFGRYYLMPLLNQFMKNFEDIHIEVILTDALQDPLKDNFDLLIRGTGYFNHGLKDSTLKSKLLMKSKIRLYASPEYLIKYGIPNKPSDLAQHRMLGYISKDKPSKEMAWDYSYKNTKGSINTHAIFHSNDIENQISACLSGIGLGRFADMVCTHLNNKNLLHEVLPEYDWGTNLFYAIYANQQNLPKRTRLLLDFIIAQMQHMATDV
jgi:LysR family transcriptional activator of dmlA